MSIITVPDLVCVDSFGRQRSSRPFTLFDSKLLGGSEPLFWDDQEVSGSGTTSVHGGSNVPLQTLSVGNLTAGMRVRQTFRQFNYQPGKAQLTQLTGNLQLTGGGAGIVAGMGYGNDSNGVFYIIKNGVPSFRLRSKVSGSVVDKDIPIGSWSVDNLDGAGKSRITLNSLKNLLSFIDFAWQSTGTVRYGFLIGTLPVYCHEERNANVQNFPWMSTPNLPVRFWIENDGTGPASSMTQICTTVISEGGSNPKGKDFYHSTSGVHLDANVTDTLYAILGIRHKASRLDAGFEFVNMSMISESTNKDFEWVMIHNPTVAGAFVYSDIPNTSFQGAKGVLANTVTGGFPMTGQFSKSSIASIADLNNSLSLGSSIDGTRDTIVLCNRPLSANGDYQAAITAKELN